MLSRSGLILLKFKCTLYLSLSAIALKCQVTATFREATKENLDLLQSMFASLTFCQEGDAAQQSSRPGQVLVEQLMPLFKLIAAKYSCDAEVRRISMVIVYRTSIINIEMYIIV